MTWKTKRQAKLDICSERERERERERDIYIYTKFKKERPTEID